jgi:hypothetical protein
LALSANAQTLWQNTRFGMPIDEVKKSFPGLRPTTAQEIKNAYPEEVTADQDLLGTTTILGTRFDVRFLLVEGKLARVLLTNIPEEMREGKADELRDSLFESLRGKYGLPSSQRIDTKYRSSPALVRTWKANGTTIRAQGMVMYGKTPFLSIVYCVESDGAENL